MQTSAMTIAVPLPTTKATVYPPTIRTALSHPAFVGHHPPACAPHFMMGSYHCRSRVDASSHIFSKCFYHRKNYPKPAPFLRATSCGACCGVVLVNLLVSVA